MEHIEVNDSLPIPIAKLLITLVDVAERNQVMNVPCLKTMSGSNAYDLLILDGALEKNTVPCKGDYLGTLETVGLVKLDENNVFLYPAALRRARYERRNRFGKWIERTVNQWRDTIVVLSFAVSVAAIVVSIIKP